MHACMPCYMHAWVAQHAPRALSKPCMYARVPAAGAERVLVRASSSPAGRAYVHMAGVGAGVVRRMQVRCCADRSDT